MNKGIGLLCCFIVITCGAIELTLTNKTRQPLGIELQLKRNGLVYRFELLNYESHTFSASNNDLSGSIIRIFKILRRQDSCDSSQWKNNSLEQAFILYRSENLEIREKEGFLMIKRVKS